MTYSLLIKLLWALFGLDICLSPVIPNLIDNDNRVGGGRGEHRSPLPPPLFL
jgi:hypothetical protein